MHTKRLTKLIPLALSLAVVAGTTSLSARAATAAPMRSIAPAASLQGDLLQNVQWRRHGHYHGHRGYHRGGAVAAGVLGGLALGAMIGAASAAPPPAAYYEPDYEPDYAQDGDWLAYCSSKYRSFDPRSGTYLGYDGLRHPCQ